MKEVPDFFAKILRILPFFLFFFLVSLLVLRDCMSIGFLVHLMLTLSSKRRGRIPRDENLHC